jgi:hypothetical protein
VQVRGRERESEREREREKEREGGGRERERSEDAIIEDGFKAIIISVLSHYFSLFFAETTRQRG